MTLTSVLIYNVGGLITALKVESSIVLHSRQSHPPSQILDWDNFEVIDKCASLQCCIDKF
jgi:hypothetical protein